MKKKNNNPIDLATRTVLTKLFAENSTEAFHSNELKEEVKGELTNQFPDGDLDAATAWITAAMHCSKEIKRVAPNVYQSINGPDPVYSDKSTGYSTDGPVRRSKDFTGEEQVSEEKRKAKKHAMDKAEDSVRRLIFHCQGFDTTESVLSAVAVSPNFDQMCVSVACKKFFKEKADGITYPPVSTP